MTHLGKAEDDPRRFYAELEHRVAERTRELEEINRRLQTEIAERRQAEERARSHLAQLAHVDRINTLGEMAAALAHEVHQPLGAIVNFARGCQRAIESKGDFSRVSDVLRKIIVQAERAAEIIRRQRAYATREGFHRYPADLNSLVRDIAELVRFGRGSVRLDFELAPDLPVVLVDRIQVQQVLLNLVSNGIDAMRETPAADRRLLVETRAAADGKVEVAVSDRGCGFPPAELDRLFDSFFSTKKGGMGLGLSICRSIVEAHGGKLSAHCNAGGGLTFVVELPVSAEG